MRITSSEPHARFPVLDLRRNHFTQGGALMKQVPIPIAAAALAALALSTPVQAQACGAGTHASAVSVTSSLGPSQPPWANVQLQVSQFAPVAGQTLIQADIVVLGGVSGSTQFEHIATQNGCTITWCLGSAVHLTLPTPTSSLDLTPQQCGSNPLATYDGTLDYGGTSGVTNHVPLTLQSQTVTITDPSVLASVFTGSGEVTFTTSANDISTHSGCPNLAAIFINDTEIIVAVVYTYCGAGVTMCVPGEFGTMTCPCGNPQLPAGASKGCNNSAGAGGAVLSSGGQALLSADSVVFTTSGETPTATSIVLQGNASNPSGSVFGQGVRCVSGSLVRLYTKHAVNGSIVAPAPGDPTVSARSAAFGDTIVAGETRWYLVYYRDPNIPIVCLSSASFNATQGQAISWQP
jgi:hypothetical protein